jgi:hypothetical protein
MSRERQKTRAGEFPRCPCGDCPRDGVCEKGLECERFRTWFRVSWRRTQALFGRNTGDKRGSGPAGGAPLRTGALHER